MDKKLVIYQTGTRKVNGVGANQYMISKFNLEKVIVVGTCAGIDDKYNILDIFVPNKAVQYDCTVKEVEPLIKKSFIVEIDLSGYEFDVSTSTIGTADKAVVMWNDYLELKNNNITIADTEAADTRGKVFGNPGRGGYGSAGQGTWESGDDGAAGFAC